MTIADQLAKIRKRHESVNISHNWGADAVADRDQLLAIIDGDREVLREIAVRHNWGGGPSAFELNDLASKRLAE